MGTDLRAIMRRDQRRWQMIFDPELTGNTLLFALAMDEVNAVSKEPGRSPFDRKTDWVDQVGLLVHGDRLTEQMRRF